MDAYSRPGWYVLSGRYSGNIFGSTFQIQYGMPDSRSPPVEPYLKCSSGSA